jgi:flavin reductase (DIM6/NTAB) family NADH-FMN oxidoreductase RutF
MKKSFGAKTLVFPTPVWVVGTYDREGKPNVMSAAWGGVCCSSPPCLAISLRTTESAGSWATPSLLEKIFEGGRLQ